VLYPCFWFHVQPDYIPPVLIWYVFPSRHPPPIALSTESLPPPFLCLDCQLHGLSSRVDALLNTLGRSPQAYSSSRPPSVLPWPCLLESTPTAFFYLLLFFWLSVGALLLQSPPPPPIFSDPTKAFLRPDSGVRMGFRFFSDGFSLPFSHGISNQGCPDRRADPPTPLPL